MGGMGGTGGMELVVQCVDRVILRLLLREVVLEKEGGRGGRERERRSGEVDVGFINAIISMCD